MKLRKKIIFSTTLALAITTLTGCNSTKSELKNMMKSGQQIELSLEMNEEAEETESKLTDWNELASLTDQPSLRNVMDDELYIISFGEGSKNGVLYVNPETEEWEPNNTIENVFKNKAFKEYWEDSEIQSAIQEAVNSVYCDVEELSSEELKLVALDSYFNLYSEDSDGGYYNGDSTVTRAQFMTALTRASEQADPEATASDELTSVLGDSENTVYASYVLSNSYLDLESKSLDETTYNGAITRAEVVYMLVKQYYSDEYDSIDLENGKYEVYSDCKNLGDIAEEAGTTGKDYYKTANLEYMIENPSKGLDEELYKAMIVAYEHGIIDVEDGDSYWNEAATKLETLSMITNVYEDLGTTCNCIMGSNDAEDFATEDSTDRLSYEQFLYETGLEDGEDAQWYYNEIYISNIDLGGNEDEVFNDVLTAIQSDNETSESTSVVSSSESSTESTGNTSSEAGTGTTDIGDSNPGQSDTSSDDGILTGAEAEALLNEINGGWTPAEDGGLTEEERAEEEEAWSSMHGY